MNQRKIALAIPVLNGNEKKYVNDCLDTGWISSIGKYVNAFEGEFARFCGVNHALSCANGTVALHLAMLAFDLKADDEVIVPTLTYIASANAVSYCGAKPVFIDAEDQTWNMNPDLIEAKITPRTRGIIVVHLYGHPTDMDPIMKIAEKHKLFVVEDAAEAHGALYKNRPVGSIGHVNIFSLFGNKIITTGEGGVITTNDDALAAKMRLLRGQGMDPARRYWFPTIGYNYRMTNIQAAIGLGQVENIQWHLSKRREVSDGYFKHLKGLTDFLDLPKEQSWARHSYWMFSVLLKETVQMTRDDFMKALGNLGIETRPLFYPMHVLPPYAEKNSTYPVADVLAARGLNLPTHAMLTEEDIAYVADSIRSVCEKK